MSEGTAEKIIKALIRIVGSLPFSLRAVVGQILGRIFWLIPTREKRIARLQLDLCLGRGAGKRIGPKVFGSIFQTAFESLNLAPIIKISDSAISFPALAQSQALLARKKGIVALTGHVGNWDLLGSYISHLGFPLSTIGRKARKASLQAVLSDLRESHGIRTLWRREGLEAKSIINELREGRVVSALIDQDTRVSSISVPFFGMSAKCPSGLVHLAKKLEVPLVSAFLVRTGWMKYEILVEEFDISKSVEEILMTYNNRLEAVLKSHPEQWVWFHKRWRTNESGKTMSTKAYIEHLASSLKKMAAMVIACLSLSSCVVFSYYSSETDLMRADKLMRDKKFPDAIQAIERHVAARLKIENRPDWENPYFHYLTIGDIYLQMGEPEKAVSAYELAEKKGVETTLVGDRYRYVASWYEKQGKLREAIAFLEKYRDRDQLMMDLMLDRLAHQALK